MVRRVQETNGLSPDVASTLVQQLVNHLRRNVFELPENNSKITRPAFAGRLESSRNSTSSQRSQETSSSSSSAAASLSDRTPEPLYIITPTYRRPEQIPELTRMSHTLMLVKNIHWLVIEDAAAATKQVTRLLERTGLKFEHLTGTSEREFDSLLSTNSFRVISASNLFARHIYLVN